MAKPNVKFMYSTAKIEGSKWLRSVSPRYNDDGQLRARYNNTNLVNHIPFGDKSQQDILKDKDRFKTFYQTDQAIAAHR